QGPVPARPRDHRAAVRRPGQRQHWRRRLRPAAAGRARRHRGRSRRGRPRRLRSTRDGPAQRRPDHHGRPDTAGRGRHRLLPVRRRGRLTQHDGRSGMTAGGYFGRALIVDASTGASEILELPDDVLRAYIGGAGLGAWLMHRLGAAGTDPLAPGAPLAYVFSPLVGTPLTTSAKFAVVARSPLTGMLTDALASSHFAIAGKLTGYDAIVVRGARPALSVLRIDGTGARFEDANDLAGLTAAQAATQLRE